MSYQLDWSEFGVVSAFSGNVLIEEIDQCDSELYEDSQYANLNYVIYDFLEADLTSLAVDEVRRTGAANLEMTHQNKNLKLGLIAEDAKSLEFLSEYKNFCDSNHYFWKVAIFSNLQEALEWCGADEAQ